jgi:hypothetical protein
LKSIRIHKPDFYTPKANAAQLVLNAVRIWTGSVFKHVTQNTAGTVIHYRVLKNIGIKELRILMTFLIIIGTGTCNLLVKSGSVVIV